MARAAAILGVHILGPRASPTRVGTLTRDAEGATAFLVDEAYLRDATRPILTLGWFVPGDDEATRARLEYRANKIGLLGSLAPWFAGLLPEGALRDLVMTEMGPGDHDQFDLITRLGGDLPGAVLITPETATPASAGPLHLERVHGFEASRPDGIVKFSLAGVQLKFAGVSCGDKLTVPGRAGETRCIIKVASEHYPRLPEAEYAGMTLACTLGVKTAPFRLIPTADIEGVPAELLRHGDHALVVDRCDRGDGGARIHMEDMAQIVGALGERKYTMATVETLLNMIRRFSTDWRADALEGFRRIVADVLIGNGDSHLKNWSFIFPAPGVIRLSPAYDIVPTILYARNDTLALPLVGTHSFERVNFRRIRRIADYLGLDPGWIEAELRSLIREAIPLWPEILPNLVGEAAAREMITRLDTLALVQEALAAS